MRAARFEYTADGWGTGEVWVRDGVLIHHELASGAAAGAGRQADRPARSAGPRHGGAGTPGVTVAGEVQHDCADFVSELCRRFDAHLDGREVDYADVPIELSWCTPLQQDIASALRRVSWGEVVSYGELAERAGRPRAPRAAGSFCAQNQLQLVLPCHRVVAANGIGSYGASGVELKRRLLALEGVEL
jgi:O-6-methylguanine DNA methyltransferase